MARSKEFDEEEALGKAMEIFWKQGYEKTSIQDLVDQMRFIAGVYMHSRLETNILFLYKLWNAMNR